MYNDPGAGGGGGKKKGVTEMSFARVSKRI